eukprot:g77417.t1
MYQREWRLTLLFPLELARHSLYWAKKHRNERAVLYLVAKYWHLCGEFVRIPIRVLKKKKTRRPPVLNLLLLHNSLPAGGRSDALQFKPSSTSHILGVPEWNIRSLIRPTWSALSPLPEEKQRAMRASAVEPWPE